MSKVKRYLINVLLGVDQLVNAITFGLPDHSISGRVGVNSANGSKIARLLEIFIDLIFFWQPNHCWKSIEWDILDRDLPNKYNNVIRPTEI